MGEIMKKAANRASAESMLRNNYTQYDWGIYYDHDSDGWISPPKKFIEECVERFFYYNEAIDVDKFMTDVGTEVVRAILNLHSHRQHKLPEDVFDLSDLIIKHL